MYLLEKNIIPVKTKYNLINSCEEQFCIHPCTELFFASYAGINLQTSGNQQTKRSYPVCRGLLGEEDGLNVGQDTSTFRPSTFPRSPTRRLGSSPATSRQKSGTTTIQCVCLILRQFILRISFFSQQELFFFNFFPSSFFSNL